MQSPKWVRLIRTTLIAAAWLTAVSTSFLIEAFAGERPMPRNSDAGSMPYYEYSVALGADTKAAVGPIDAEKMVKIQFETLEKTAEKLRICIFERYCEVADLSEADDRLKRPIVDFTDAIKRVTRDYGAPGKNGLGKTFLTVQREKPDGKSDTIDVVLRVETDHTAEIPRFTMINDIAHGPSSKPDGTVDLDTAVKDVDLPETSLIIQKIDGQKSDGSQLTPR